MGLDPQFNSRRQWLTNAVFVRFFWLVAHLTPQRLWFRIALAFARFLTRTAGRFAPKGRNVDASSLTPRLLHRFLDQLSVHNASFPIPVRVEGKELMREYAASPSGFVCCSAHIPFIKLFSPVMREVIGDSRPISVIAREPVGDNQVMMWNDIPCQAIPTDHATLLRSRSLLKQNGCLIVIVDKEQGEFISSNIFRFANKMHAPVLMWFCRLQPNGEILLRIVQPPGPHCRSEQEIRANLDFVAENVRSILSGGSIAPVRSGSAVEEEPPELQRSREINRIQLYSNAQLETRMRRLQAMLHTLDGTGTPQRKLLEERLLLMQLELETRTSVSELV